MLRVVVLLAMTGLAFADSSVVMPRELPAHCSVSDGPLARYGRDNDGFVVGPGGGKLALIQATPRHRVAITAPGSSSVAFVLDAKGRSLMEHDAPGCAVENTDGSLAGFIHITPSQQLVFFNIYQRDLRWSHATGATIQLSCAAVTDGFYIAVATHVRDHAGANLTVMGPDIGRDTRSRWTVSSTPLVTSWGKYASDVAVTLRGTTVSLISYETGGCSWDSFDLATGKRLGNETARP